MRARIPAVVAVVGALLVGGATTGTTLASWRDQAPTGSGAVRSGTFAFDIAGAAPSTVVALGTLPQLGRNFGSLAGEPRHVQSTLNYSVTGKNGLMQLRITHLDESAPGLRPELEVAGSLVSTGSPCPVPASTAYARVEGPGGGVALGTVSGATGSRRLCLSFRVRGGAPDGVAGRSGTVTLTLTASQVRP